MPAREAMAAARCPPFPSLHPRGRRLGEAAPRPFSVAPLPFREGPEGEERLGGVGGGVEGTWGTAICAALPVGLRGASALLTRLGDGSLLRKERSP